MVFVRFDVALIFLLLLYIFAYPFRGACLRDFEYISNTFSMMQNANVMVQIEMSLIGMTQSGMTLILFGVYCYGPECQDTESLAQNGMTLIAKVWNAMTKSGMTLNDIAWNAIAQNGMTLTWH